MRTQRIPINMYAEQGRIMVAAPMPGMEPATISVTVDDRRLAIAGELRGPGQERTKQYLIQEWSSGPYEHTVDLPRSVDATKANASYDNGVLVVILPTASRSTSGKITLAKLGTAKGLAVGHTGHDFRTAR